MNPQGEGRASEYEFRDGKTVWVRPGHETPVVLAGFTARIVREIELDDGGGAPSLSFEVEAATRNRKRTIRVPAAEFEFMQWPIRTLGATAVIQPGLGVRERLRVAIQELSGDVERVRVYAHTGWGLLPDGRAVYLHAQGGIGSAGALPNIQVQLPEPLQAMALPPPPARAGAQQAVRASLQLADAGPAHLTFPCLAGIYRSMLGDTPFSIAIVGPTGVFKTEFAALCQQHCGANFGVSRLLSWTSTENYLEEIAFVAKDALLVIDDFAPNGVNGDSGQLNRRADRVLRAQGNRSGRGRMRSDLSLRPTHAPRGLTFLTGEEFPLGQSLRARFLAIEVEPGVIPKAALTQCQAHAAAGLYAEATAGYVQWLADRILAIQQGLPGEVAKLRDEMAALGGHKRTPESVANLEIGFRYFLEYAVAIEAIDQEVKARLLRRCRDALHQLAAAQERHQDDANPESVFVDLVRAALGSGRAHVAAIDGTVPQTPEGWGWARRPGGIDGIGSPILDPKGERIGWVDPRGVYLLYDAAFAVAHRMARDQGTRMATGLRTLERGLYGLGLIAQIETRGGKRRFQVRKTIQGVQRSVLHLRPDVLFGPKPDQEPPALEMELPAADQGDGPKMGDSFTEGHSDRSSDA